MQSSARCGTSKLHTAVILKRTACTAAPKAASASGTQNSVLHSAAVSCASPAAVSLLRAGALPHCCKFCNSDLLECCGGRSVAVIAVAAALTRFQARFSHACAALAATSLSVGSATAGYGGNVSSLTAQSGVHRKISAIAHHSCCSGSSSLAAGGAAAAGAVGGGGSGCDDSAVCSAVAAVAVPAASATASAACDNTSAAASVAADAAAVACSVAAIVSTAAGILADDGAATDTAAAAAAAADVGSCVVCADTTAIGAAAAAAAAVATGKPTAAAAALQK